MKTLRVIATLMVMGPFLGLIGTAIGMVRSFNLMTGSNALAAPDKLAHSVAIALITTCVGLAVFPFGVFLHGFVAHKTQTYRRETWIFIFVVSLCLALYFPVGTVFAVITIFLLFNLDTFKKMKTAGKASRASGAEDTPQPDR